MVSDNTNQVPKHIGLQVDAVEYTIVRQIISKSRCEESHPPGLLSLNRSVSSHLKSSGLCM